MRDFLQVSHEGTIEVKKTRVNTLTNECELFQMKPEEKHFNQIVNHRRTFYSNGKMFFSNCKS